MSWLSPEDQHDFAVVAGLSPPVVSQLPAPRITWTPGELILLRMLQGVWDLPREILLKIIRLLQLQTKRTKRLYRMSHRLELNRRDIALQDIYNFVNNPLNFGMNNPWQQMIYLRDRLRPKFGPGF